VKSQWQFCRRLKKPANAEKIIYKLSQHFPFPEGVGVSFQHHGMNPQLFRGAKKCGAGLRKKGLVSPKLPLQIKSIP
jgi:hypothetical protein